MKIESVSIEGTMVRVLLIYEIHKILFSSFPFELYEWIARLADSQGRFRLDKPIVWTLELLYRLEALEDKIA